MASQDPRTTIYNIVSAIPAANLKKDDGATNAKVLHVWEGGPELLKYLFYTSDYDVVFTYGEPRSRSARPIQDVPLHYNMEYPITVSTVDKPLTGVLLCTSSRMQYKATYALRNIVEASAQSASGVSPAYTLRVISDDAVVRSVAGVKIWETKHTLMYEEG